MTHVKDVLKYGTIEEFKKSIIISPETKHRPKKQKLDFNPFVNYGINNFHHAFSVQANPDRSLSNRI